MERSRINRITRMPRRRAAVVVMALAGLLAVGLAEAQEAAESAPRRMVIRTTADGKVEVVRAEEAAADEAAKDKVAPGKVAPGRAAPGKAAKARDDKDRAALEAMAQRLWVADSAQQTLEQTKSGKAGPRGGATVGAKSARRQDGGAIGLQGRLLGASQRTATGLPGGNPNGNPDVTPCLATADHATDLDPCEVARRIGRLQPCRTPQECDAYDAWRRQYGAPGLRAAAPDAAAPDDPPKP